MKTHRRDNFVFDPSLVLYLPLYEQDGASFMSKDAYGHLATVTGALWTLQGRRFDGIDDRVNCGDGTSLDLNQMTLEAWIKLSQLGIRHMIMGRDDGVNRNFRFWVDLVNVLYADIWVGNAIKSRSGTSILSANVWYHTVFTYDKQYMRLYLNGVAELTSTAQTGDVDNDDESFLIGIYGDLTTLIMKGVIGEVRAYNRALSPIEIQQNCLATKWRYIP